jgi:hypothetical protein
MAIKVTWDSADQTIVRFDFEGKWNFLDFDYAVNESISLMKKVSHRVNWLMNLDAGGPLAAGAVLESRELREPLPEHHGAIVFVGNPMFAHGIATILSRVYPVLGEGFHFEENLTDARLTLAHLLEPVTAE